MLILTFISDCWYFWKNNFRKKQEGEGENEKKLNKIIIDVEKCTIAHNSIKRMQSLCSNYSHKRIKAVHTMEYIKRFREDLDINKQLQFLVFG